MDVQKLNPGWAGMLGTPDPPQGVLPAQHGGEHDDGDVESQPCPDSEQRDRVREQRVRALSNERDGGVPEWDWQECQLLEALCPSQA